jgi:hypothetical protein
MTLSTKILGTKTAYVTLSIKTLGTTKAYVTLSMKTLGTTIKNSTEHYDNKWIVSLC